MPLKTTRSMLLNADLKKLPSKVNSKRPDKTWLTKPLNSNTSKLTSKKKSRFSKKLLLYITPPMKMVMTSRKELKTITITKVSITVLTMKEKSPRLISSTVSDQFESV